MAPRKNTTAPAPRRQLSMQADPVLSDGVADSDLDDGGFDPVQVATDLQKAIEGHKKRRFAARKKIEKTCEANLADIVKRTERRLAEREKELALKRPEQLTRLVAAVEARDAKQRAAADKVARFYDGCVNLASLLENVYAGLAEEARSAAVATEEGSEGRGA